MKKKEVKPTYPSLYGSHSVMLVDPQPEDVPQGMVCLEDGVGQYTTHSDRLDSGLADPRRWERQKAER